MTMTNEELSVLHSYIDKASIFLEFGAGESTVYASKASNISKIDSVESSGVFINDLIKSNPCLTKAIDNKKLFIHKIDIGETKSWGYPKNYVKKHLWPNYSQSVFISKSEHDLVLVDGRFRVACTLISILNTPDNSIIMVHDFWNRPEYQFLLKFLDVVDRVDTLGIFKKKEVTYANEIQKLILKYRYLPGDLTSYEKLKRKVRKKLNRLKRTV